MSVNQSRGLTTHPQSAPLVRFPLPAAQREPLTVPTSRKGFCELCGNPLKKRQKKFCNSQPFDCRKEFYRICQQQGVAIVSRLIFLRRTRPSGGQSMTGEAKQANREIWQLTDDLIHRMNDARKELKQ